MKARSILLCLVFLPFSFGLSLTPSNEMLHVKKETKKKVLKGTAKMLSKFGLTDIELAILLVEYDPKAMARNNPGNLRRTKEYMTFPTLEEGIRRFKRTIKSYKCPEGPDYIECLSKKYSEMPEEWARRVKLRLCQIQKTKSLKAR